MSRGLDVGFVPGIDPQRGVVAPAKVNPVLVANYTVGTYSFAAPADGWYVFHMSGSGGAGYAEDGTMRPGGASGGRARRRVKLSKGQAVGLLIGAGGRAMSFDNNNRAPGQTVITWPDSTTTTLVGGENSTNSGATPAGGAVSGIFDEAIPGISGDASGSGSNAPALSVPGLVPGIGGASGTRRGEPGAGSGAGGGSINGFNGSYGTSGPGAAGQVAIFREV